MATMLSKVWRRSSRAICRASGRWRNANWFAADGCLCVAVLSALPLCSGGELRPADFDREPGAAGGEKIRRDCDGWYW